MGFGSSQGGYAANYAYAEPGKACPVLNEWSDCVEQYGIQLVMPLVGTAPADHNSSVFER